MEVLEKRCQQQLEQMYPHRHFQSLHQNKTTQTYCYLMEYRKYCRTYIIASYCRINNANFDQIQWINTADITNLIFNYFMTPYFVKIHPTNPKYKSIAKELASDKYPYKQTLANHIIIPLRAVRNLRDSQSQQKYNVVQYEFIRHVTLQTIAFSAIQTKRLNPRYFLQTPTTNAWSARECKLKMIDVSLRVIEIDKKLRDSNLIESDKR